MIKAVVFDMFETLVTLFTGRTYFSEDIAKDIGFDPELFRKKWHTTEKERSTGKLTVAQGLGIVLGRLGIGSPEKTDLILSKRKDCLRDTFSAIPDETFRMLDALKSRKIKIGLITNTFSDERDFIRQSDLFPYFDAALISFEQGLCKPDLELYRRMTDLLHVSPDECLYVGDGGSMELQGAEKAGMHPVQCTWFHELAFEPHIPCPILEEFDHAASQSQILDFLD